MNWHELKQYNLSINDSPFVHKNFCDFPSEILSWEDVNSCLYRRDVVWEIIEKHGWKSNIPFNDAAWYGGHPDPGFLLNSINSGKGFVITHFGRYNETINSICRDVESNFYAASDAHVYGGLNGGESFKIHCDSTVNFILQIEGETHWKVFKNRNSPISTIDPVFPEEKDLEIAVDINLQPGDLLYIPQNCYHKASPSKKRLSLTIAMFPKTFNTPTINRSPLQINY